MTTTISQFIYPTILQPVRLVQGSNLSGVYYNGPLNNGVGATLDTDSPSLVVDGNICNNGDSLLLQNQTNAAANGIYVVSGVLDNIILTRRSDFHCAPQMRPGFTLFSTGGDTYAAVVFTLIDPAPSVVGTSSIIFKND